jgi:solute carrier family 66 (lysosomal lysine-arginine transporter), member 1
MSSMNRFDSLPFDQGLTMSLFVCAFLGNLFYVASILMNPTLDEPIPISTEYISESIP